MPSMPLKKTTKTQRRTPTHQRLCRKRRHPARADYPLLRYPLYPPNLQRRARTFRRKDILGHVYEYFLSRFAQAEGKRSGQYFTPKSIVSLIVEMLEPYSGRVYDPAMGSGGFSCKPNALSPPIKATSTTFPSTGKNSTRPLETRRHEYGDSRH